MRKRGSKRRRTASSDTEGTPAAMPNVADAKGAAEASADVNGVINADFFWDEDKTQSSSLAYTIATSNDYRGTWQRNATDGTITFPTSNHKNRFMYDPRRNGKSGPSPFMKETMVIAQKYGGVRVSDSKIAFPNREKWLAYINDEDHEGLYSIPAWEIKHLQRLQDVLKKAADKVKKTAEFAEFTTDNIVEYAYFFVNGELIKVKSMDIESPISIPLKGTIIRFNFEKVKNDEELKAALDKYEEYELRSNTDTAQDSYDRPRIDIYDRGAWHILDIKSMQPVGKDTRTRLVGVMPKRSRPLRGR